MIWQHTIQNNIEYKYVMRLRPDMGVFAPLPTSNIATFLNDRLVIRVVDRALCCCGNEDWFGIGHFEAMMPYLERIYQLQDIMYEHLKDLGWSWTAESFLVDYMQKHFNVQIKGDLPIAGCIVKPTNRVNPSDA
jgi:hypothetical protein